MQAQACAAFRQGGLCGTGAALMYDLIDLHRSRCRWNVASAHLGVWYVLFFLCLRSTSMFAS